MYISVENHADASDVQTVERGLEAFNLAHTGVSSQFERISIFVREDDGTIRGGLLGGTYWGWLYVSILWLHDDIRGQGYGQQLTTTRAGLLACPYSFLYITPISPAKWSASA